MKLSKNWKRIIAGFMAAAMVFLSVDSGCVSALAAEIQEWNNEQEITVDRPTGYHSLEMITVDDDMFEGEVYNYQELAEIQNFSAVYNNEWDKYSTKYYYNQLNDEWKKVWDALDLICLNCLVSNEGVLYEEEYNVYYLKSITLPENTTVEEGLELIELFMSSNPQYYFLGNNFLANVDDTETYLTEFAFCLYNMFGNNETRAEETLAFKAAIETVLDDEKISPNASESDKLKYVHDYIVNKVEYNHVITEDNVITDEEDEVALSQSAYSVLCMDKTVCAGYAETLTLLCNGLNIDAASVTSANHMWNKVRINDSWYNVDATWADFGKEYPIYYDYYGRSDMVYDADVAEKVYSHTELEMWTDYIPACIKDTNPSADDDYLVPGTFDVPEVTLPAPVIEVTLNQEYLYDVTILLDEEYKDATIYYTLDGTEPSVALTKSLIYSDTFAVEADTVIKAVAVLDGYYDSDVVEKEVVLTIENATIQSHFYKEFTFTWDVLGETVDGYVINVYNGTDSTKIGQSIDVPGGDVNFYVYDTAQLTTVTSVYYEIYGYILDEEQNKVAVTEIAKTGKSNVNLLTEPLDVDVKWYVTTSDGVNYLVINVEEKTQENKQDKLCLWYYTDKNGVEYVNIFTLDMTDGATEFKYSLDKHGMPYDKIGYVFITDDSKSTAFQKDGFAVGGEYRTPMLEPIEDVYLQSSGETTTLNAVIIEDSAMNNFNYKYQWYVAEDVTSEGNPIDGATNPSYTVQIGSFDVEYYYCKVTAEYLEEKVFETTNGTQHTRVEGALYETEITYEPIEDQVFTGNPIEVNDLVVLKNALNETLELGKDYTLAYENNLYAGDATIIVDFINDYASIDESKDNARINFKIVPKTVSETSKEFEFTDVITGKEYIYNGSAHEPSMTVKDVARNYVLVKDEDYDITYNANVNAGTATITLNFKGNYQGRVVIDFEIKPKSTENVEIDPIRDYVYTGTAIIPELTITDKDNGKKLVVDTDYTVTCVNNTDAGTATVTVKFVGNYIGADRTIDFYIEEKNGADADVLITEIADQEYTGSEIKPIFAVVYGGNTLTEGTDYTVTYANNVDIGQEATITLTFGNNYYGTKTTTFNIVARKAENLTYSEITEEYTYNGSEHKPVVEVKNGDIVLQPDVDYVLSYENNTDAGIGTGKVIISFDDFEGNSKYYTGEITREFTIKPRNIMADSDNIDITVETLADYTYNGTAFEPGVTVVDNGLSLEDEDGVNLVKDKDFKVSYENNINAGNATIIIDFTGNYEGQTQEAFKILQKEIVQSDIEVEEIENQTYNGQAIIPTIVVKEKVSGVELRLNDDYTVTGIDNSNINAGTAYLKVSLELEGNYIYKGEDIEVSFVIEPRDSANVVISRIDSQEYTGSAITPNLVVRDSEIDVTLVAGRDYIATYSNNVNVGTATVTITLTGNFTGDAKTTTFTIINPIPTSITSSVFSIDQTRNYISKITVGTTAHTLLSNLKESKYVSLRDKNGAGFSGATILGTGMIACIVDGSKVERTYTIIVTGDTNGDGKINITDMIAVKACTLKKSGLSGVYEKAGDVNGDGKINITDFIKVKATTLKKDAIVGVSVN